MMSTRRRPRQVREFHVAVGGGEQGVVAAAPDVVAGVEVVAALAHDDRARRDLLTTETLHAQALGHGITAVA